MKIIELRAENVKRIKAIDIRPDSALVQVTGRNGQGKSSTLDSIWIALAGLSAAPSVLIRQGQERAMIKLDMGELVVTRTFNAKEGGGFTHNVKVESDEGAKFSSPQAVLDALVGELSFDPLAFTRMGPKAQFEALKKLVPGVDFDAIAKRRLDAFTTRTAKKGRAEELRAQANGVVLPAGKIPAPVDLTVLETALGAAADHNAMIERRKSGRQDTAIRADIARSNAIDRRERAAAMIKEAEAYEAEEKGFRDQMESAEALPEPIDTVQVQADLQAARTNNATAALAARRRELETAASTAEAEVVTLTATIAACDKERADAVKAAKMPVEGLGFGEEAILLNGFPFDQASDSLQLRTSIAIAGALNPRLRVIRVRDGSLLDEDAMKLLEAYAEENDLQVWIERVDSSGSVGFVLENGQLKGDEPIVDEPAAPAEEEEGV